jgi:hypothetical protein
VRAATQRQKSCTLVLSSDGVRAVTTGGGMYVAADCVMNADTSDFSSNTASAGGASVACMHGETVSAAPDRLPRTLPRRHHGRCWRPGGTDLLVRALQHRCHWRRHLRACFAFAVLHAPPLVADAARLPCALQLPDVDTAAHAGAPASLTVTSTVMDSNVATSDGGALALLSGSVSLTSGAVSSNTAGADGGGISVKVRTPVWPVCMITSRPAC